MKKAPIPKNELQRLKSLYALGLLDTKPEKRFDLITKLATKIFNVPISTLTLVDAKREWFKSCVGLTNREGERAISFCGHAVVDGEAFIIEDATKDPRFADNPMVVGKPYIRFYAGVPIVSRDGQKIGVFCIKDIKPKKLSKDETEILKGLASWAQQEINLQNNRIVSVELERLRAESNAVIQSIGEGVVVIDRNKKIISINNQACKLLHIKEQDAIGSYYYKLWDVKDKDGKTVPLSNRPIQISLKTKKPFTTTIGTNYSYVRKDGTSFPVSITIAPINLNKENIGVVDLFRDCTFEKATDRAKSEFVSLASHQLRTPLSAIGWYSEMLLAEKAGRLNKSQKEYLNEVYHGNKRMVELVQVLLDISRMEMGTFVELSKLTDLKLIIKGILEDFKQDIKKKKINISVVFESQLPKIHIDQRLIDIVFTNLISNAIRYSPNESSIDISISKTDSKFLFKVSDQGCGIPKKQQSRVFERFFRADNVVKKVTEGTGLGLYLSKMIVERMKGKIWFESKENEGTTFFVEIPFKKNKKYVRHNKTSSDCGRRSSTASCT